MRLASYDLVDAPVIRATLKKRDFNTDDIIAQVQEVIYTDADDTQRLAARYPRTVEGLRQLYRDVYNRIRYVEDPNFYQWVQTPSFLWHHSRRGDCKSLTVFISSVLQNMGIPHLIRYTSYDFSPWRPERKKKFKHVYPVALLNGREIPMDIVYQKQENGRFGTEKPFARKRDIAVERGLYKLGTTQSEQDYVRRVEETFAEMKAAMADIPDEIVSAGGGDITQMTAGELERDMWRDRFEIFARHEGNLQVASRYRDAAVAMQRGSIAGLRGLYDDELGRQVEGILRETDYKTAPAFQDFELKIEAPEAVKMSGLFQDIGKFFKKVGETFSDLFNKFVNWIWKGPAKDMGPYYLFLFADEGKVLSPEIRRRIREQKKSFDHIAQKGKFNTAQLRGVMLNGIKDKTGLSPKEIFAEAGEASRIGALPAILIQIGGIVLKAIGWVIKIIEKIVNLFKSKKSDAGIIDETTMSDVKLLEEEARLQANATKGSGTGSGEGSGGGGSAGLLASLAIGLPLLFRAA